MGLDFASMTEIAQAQSARGETARVERAIGACPKCGHVNVDLGSTYVKCGGAGCTEKVRLRWITGTFTGSECDDTCMYARGRSCDCSCGGWNHGSGWIFGQRPTVEVERHRARVRREHAETVAKRERRQADKAAAARRDAEAARAEAERVYPVLARVAEFPPTDTDTSFYYDVWRKWTNGEDMSARQCEALANAVQRKIDWAERDAARAAERQALVDSGVRVVAGTRDITGTVVSLRETHDPYSYDKYAMITRITVRTDDGLVFHSRFPKCLEPEWTREIADDFVGWKDRVKGQRVSFRATVKPSDDDPLVGFAKNPRACAGTRPVSIYGPDGQDAAPVEAAPDVAAVAAMWVAVDVPALAAAWVSA